jgi:hypothetical protein
MSGHISERSKEPLEQIRQAGLFAPLGLGSKAVERDSGHTSLPHPTRRIDQSRSIQCESAFLSKLLGNALGRLKNSVEVVLLKKLGSTEAEHVGMNATTLELGSKTAGALLRLGEGPNRRRRSQFSVVAQLETAKSESLVQRRSTIFELGDPAGISHGVHRCVDESHDIVSTPVLVLSGGKRLEEAIPLRHRRVRVADRAGPQELADLGAGQAAVRLPEDFTDRPQLGFLKNGNRCHRPVLPPATRQDGRQGATAVKRTPSPSKGKVTRKSPGSRATRKQRRTGSKRKPIMRHSREG